jgi:hypothetical protein
MFAVRRAAGVLGGVAAAGSFVAAASDSNSAFVFIKPHANTAKAQALVSSTLKSKGVTISTEGELTGEQIDRGMLIDQHYYAIASKATLLKPKDMPVPADKFEAAFGLPWAKALEQGTVFNALGERGQLALGPWHCAVGDDGRVGGFCRRVQSSRRRGGWPRCPLGQGQEVKIWRRIL